MLLRVLLIAAIATAVLPQPGAAATLRRVDPCTFAPLDRQRIGEHPGEPVALEVQGIDRSACALTFTDHALRCEAHSDAAQAYATAATLRVGANPADALAVVDWAHAYQQWNLAVGMCDAAGATRANQGALDAMRRMRAASER